MTNWMKRNDEVQDFVSYVVSKSGRTPSMLVEERDPDKEYHTGRLIDAAERLVKAKDEGRTVCGVFDYDADGLCSAAEAHLLLSKMGIRHTLTIPRRMTDGYGVNPDIIARLEEGAVLLTVDNGIAANDAIRAAKDKGMEVIILDHHNAHFKDGLDVEKLVAENNNVPKEEWFDLPCADLIIDPEAMLVSPRTKLPDGWDYGHYCGAGLVFKLACILYEQEPDFIDDLSTFAAIATIGDSVDVTADNARIIEHGLSCINHGKGTEGLREILKLIKKEGDTSPYDTETIAYYLAPMINAPGRLEDEGGNFVLQCFFSTGAKARANAAKLKEYNEARKQHVEDAMENAAVLGKKIAFVYDETIPEGVCGIIAAKLCEKYHKPAFVMTMAENGKVKGSSRGNDGDSILTLLRSCEDTLTGFGGHDQAAGFSLMPDKVQDFRRALEKAAKNPVEDDVQYYDIDILPKDVHKLYVDQNHLGIFGQGLEVPVIKMTAMAANPQTMGADKTHLRFTMANTKCVAFGLAQKYEDLGKPLTMTIYGRVGINWFRGIPNAQIQVIDFETVEAPEE